MSNLRKVVFPVCIVAFVCVLCLLVTHVYFGKSTVSDVEKSHKHRIRRLGSNNRVFTGFVSDNHPLEEGEFISYKSSDDSFTLISDFDMNEYMCTGSCHCEVDRRTVVSVSTGVKFLIAAISSFVAVNIAISHFDEHCLSRLMDSCPSNEGIKSEIENCDELVLDEKSETNRISRYLCSGNCMEVDPSDSIAIGAGEAPGVMILGFHTHMEREWDAYLEEKKRWNCDKMELSTEIDLETSHFEYVERLPQLMEWSIDNPVIREEWLATMMFTKNNLNPYCHEISSSNVPNIGFKFPYCTGEDPSRRKFQYDKLPEGKLNKSVKCMLVE